MYSLVFYHAFALCHHYHFPLFDPLRYECTNREGYGTVMNVLAQKTSFRDVARRRTGSLMIIALLNMNGLNLSSLAESARRWAASLR